MKTLGWPFPFQQVAWSEIATFLGAMADKHPEFRHMAAIAESVIVSERTESLAGCTSMHDLIVVPLPLPEPPYDVVVVRAPGSLHPPRNGEVIIEHLACSGRNDRIVRPVADAVPLFWRFMIEKYGVAPNNPQP